MGPEVYARFLQTASLVSGELRKAIEEIGPIDFPKRKDNLRSVVHKILLRPHASQREPAAKGRNLLSQAGSNSLSFEHNCIP